VATIPGVLPLLPMRVISRMEETRARDAELAPVAPNLHSPWRKRDFAAAIWRRDMAVSPYPGLTATQGAAVDSACLRMREMGRKAVVSQEERTHVRPGHALS